MKREKNVKDVDAPEVTEEQVARLRANLLAAPRAPLRATGALSRCPTCGGKMITTNSIERTIPTPGVIYVVSRLPGAQCQDCGSTELDSLGVAIVESSVRHDRWADYETAVTHTSGSTTGTYFKKDLARVLDLHAAEKLSWKIVDRDRAFVEVIRRKSGKSLKEPSGTRHRTGARSKVQSARTMGSTRELTEAEG